MLTVEQAKAKILEGAEAVAEVEDMVTLYSAGKILAQDIVSEIKVPPLDNSQMDGYAVRCADFAGGRRNFPVSQRIFAGHVGTELEPDTVARIFTGAPIPPEPMRLYLRKKLPRWKTAALNSIVILKPVPGFEEQAAILMSARLY